MQDLDSSQIQATKKIEQAFRKHRRRNGEKGWYPAKLKSMALAALDGGVAGRVVASAAGVTPKSLRNWRNKSDVVPPEELKIVNAHDIHESKLISGMMARVMLPSGIQIEIPATALTATLIAALNGSGV